MKNSDFTVSVIVEQSPEEVFNAINSPEKWWSGEIVGRAKTLNDEFNYRYEDFHLSKQKVTELVPEKRVVWLVTDSQINYVDDKNEWTNTRIIFEISKAGDKTKVVFTHEGLTDNISCYDSCSSSWSKLIQESLVSFIRTGKASKPALV
jgi:uncharacterized protein YndB with AHSA1/START domain